jgi:NAD(P)H-dependent flavin oxidoreductase YrpB (nitropropane dioxygenase family)
MRSSLLDLLGIDVPVVLAPMGGAVGPELAAAISNAGGLGILPVWSVEPAVLRERVRQTQALTRNPIGVNLNLAIPQEDRLAAALEEGVPIISFFWGEAPGLIRRAKAWGATVLMTVASAAEARRAVDAGADAVVAQGWEAGGHVRGSVATMPLVPAVVDAVAPVPVIAAGGISDGRGLAASMALGAAGVWMGTRFLAASEATIHPHYRQRLLAARETDTVHLADLFDIGWPDAPHRVLRNSVVDQWEAAGKPPPGARPREGEIIVRMGEREIPIYGCFTPQPTADGEVEAMPMWAGQGVHLVREVKPAAAILADIQREWRQAVQGLGP